MSETDATRVPATNPAATRLASMLGVASEGCPVILGIVGVGAIVLLTGGLALGYWSPGIAIMVAAAGIGAFFRDPERTPQGSADAILSAADGRVTHIGESALPGGDTNEIHRQVSVFLSPLDVHVNRAPISGEIVRVTHTPGEFRAAFRDDASARNERNLVIFAGADGQRHALVQVAGYLARRIVCRVREHQRVERGERIGLIMFGSRVDHFMPRGYRITVGIGDRVRAGESIIGEPDQ